MKASDLRDRIYIYRQETTRTQTGAFEVSYEYKCSCRARINYSSGNRTIDNEEIFYSTERTFIVRHYVPVVETDQIRWDDKKWQILSIDHDRKYNNIVIKTTLINE